MYDDNVATTSGFISGEVKLGITIRLIAGVDAYDLYVIFYVHFDYYKRILYEV